MQALILSDQAIADSKVAVFGFELVKEQHMTGGIAPPSASEDEMVRLGKMTALLEKLLNETGELVLVDVSQVKPKRPFYDCNGCDVELAKTAGADYSITGKVHKASATLINISIVVRDVATKELKRSGAVSIRENSEQGWLRAVRQLVRNRILREPL